MARPLSIMPYVSINEYLGIKSMLNIFLLIITQPTILIVPVWFLIHSLIFSQHHPLLALHLLVGQKTSKEQTVVTSLALALNSWVTSHRHFHQRRVVHFHLCITKPFFTNSLSVYKSSQENFLNFKWTKIVIIIIILSVTPWEKYMNYMTQKRKSIGKPFFRIKIKTKRSSLRFVWLYGWLIFLKW